MIKIKIKIEIKRKMAYVDTIGPGLGHGIKRWEDDKPDSVFYPL